jgi:hypothetical protein
MWNWILVLAFSRFCMTVYADDMQSVMDEMEVMERNISKRIKDLQEIIAEFQFQTKNNKALQARIKYIRHRDKLKPIRNSAVEIQILPQNQCDVEEIGDYRVFSAKPKSGWAYVTSFFGANRPVFEYWASHLAALESMEFGRTGREDCVIRKFELSLISDLDASPVLLKRFSLDQNRDQQSFRLPMPVAFRGLTLRAVSNHGNGSLKQYCLPRFRVFGWIP